MPSPRVAIFRASDDATGTAAALEARGFLTALAPVTQFVALAAAVPSGPFDFAVATSAHAFGGAVPRLPLYVVGERTAAAARRAGLAVASAADDAAALIPRLPAGRGLYLAGRDRKPDLERALAGRIAVMEVYCAQARAAWTPGEAEAVAAADAALHYSPRAAALAVAFAEAAGRTPAFRRLVHVCLSRDVAASLGGAARVLWPQRPAEAPLLDALESGLADRL